MWMLYERWTVFLVLSVPKDYRQSPWKIPAKDFIFKERYKLKCSNFTEKELLHKILLKL